MANRFPPDLDPGAFWQEPDFLLSELVSFLANKMDAEVGITLLIHGTVFTGTLVSEREYLEAIAETLKDMTRNLFERPSKDELLAIDEVFNPDAMIEDTYPSDEVESENTPEVPPSFDEDGPPSIRYVHLREPVIIYPGATLGFGESSLPIMRVRLTEISGWMMGRIMMMTPSQDSDEEDDPRRNYPRRRFIQ